MSKVVPDKQFEEEMYLIASFSHYQLIIDYVLALQRRHYRPRTPRILQPHGTNAAYYRHFREKTQPCEPCREAHREYGRAATQKRRSKSR